MWCTQVILLNNGRRRVAQAEEEEAGGETSGGRQVAKELRIAGILKTRRGSGTNGRLSQDLDNADIAKLSKAVGDSVPSDDDSTAGSFSRSRDRLREDSTRCGGPSEDAQCSHQRPTMMGKVHSSHDHSPKSRTSGARQYKYLTFRMVRQGRVVLRDVHVQMQAQYWVDGSTAFGDRDSHKGRVVNLALEQNYFTTLEQLQVRGRRLHRLVCARAL